MGNAIAFWLGLLRLRRSGALKFPKGRLSTQRRTLLFGMAGEKARYKFSWFGIRKNGYVRIDVSAVITCPAYLSKKRIGV